MGDEGFEPSTNGLRVQCSTVELVTRPIYNYSKSSLGFASLA